LPTGGAGQKSNKFRSVTTAAYQESLPILPDFPE